MEKVCQDWSKEAFDDKLVNASYWDEFARNAETASAEIIRVANMASAARELQRISDELGAHNILAVGGAENPALQQVYDQLAESGPTVYTDKFDIAEHAPTADLGISIAEFGVGETADPDTLQRAVGLVWRATVLWVILLFSLGLAAVVG